MSGNRAFGEGEDPNENTCVDQDYCRIWTQGNCRISFCNNEPDLQCDPASTWGNRARAIEAGCKYQKMGGYESKAPPQKWTEVAIRLSTEWRVFSDQLVYKEMSVEENKAELRAMYDGIESVAPASSGVDELQSRVCTTAFGHLFFPKLTLHDAASGQIQRRSDLLQRLHARISSVGRTS
jgi:hypothetical protein